MRLTLATLFVAAGISCCCGDIPAMLGLDTPAVPDIAADPVADAPVVTAVVIEAPKPSGPTVIASVSTEQDTCKLKVETLGGAERVVTFLPYVCPPAASLVLHPDGSRLLVTEETGITAVDVASGAPTRLDALPDLVAVGWDAAGNTVALTSTVVEPQTDPAGKFVLADGERLALGPDADSAMELAVGRVFTLDGTVWKKTKQIVGYGFEGQTNEDVYRAELTPWVRRAPDSLLDRERDLGKVLTENTPGPGEWRQDGVLAFQFEWLEGVMAHGPAALRLPDGTWKALAGFESGGLTWTERADVLWLQLDGGKSVVLDVKTGETKWETAGPAWLLPLDVTLVPRQEVDVAAIPVPDTQPKPPPGAVSTRRAQPKGQRAAGDTPAAAPAPPAPKVEEVEEDEMPVYEPPPDLDEPAQDMKRKRGGGKKKKNEK
jgi:hypothetical protein